MENASKALIIAAEVLIGMILLSLIVYMFINFAITSAELHKDNEQKQLNQFNSQFTSYEGKDELTIYDVVTIANLATENNIYYEYEKIDSSTELKGDSSYIRVKIKNSDLGAYNNACIEKGYTLNRSTSYKQNITKYYNDLIQNALNNDPLREYECTVKTSEITGRVYLVTFTAKPK